MSWKLACLALGLAVGACGSVSENNHLDAKLDSPGACVAETDVELCTAATACENRMFTDKCGVARTVDCGACGGGMGCVVGTCKTPVCSGTNYTSANFPNMARASIEDSIGDVTPDGQVVLYIPTVASASACGGYHLVVADEVTPGSGTYTQRDVSAAFTTLGLFNGQGSYAISADGLSITTVSSNRKQLMTTTRSAINMTDFGTASTADFDNINQQTNSNSLLFMHPVMSPDGLEFWYATYSDPNAGGDGSQKIFYSVRATKTDKFPAGTAAYAPVSTYPYVASISSDRLTLFVFDGFTSRMLARSSTSGQFTNPNAPAAPPQVTGGWDHKPLADCAKLIAMYSPGGCGNEDVVVLTRQ
jgi:hypothetical protein